MDIRQLNGGLASFAGGQNRIMSEYPRMLHTILDTTRARELAEFYRKLLGLVYRPGDEPPTDGSADDADWMVLLEPGGPRGRGGRLVARRGAGRPPDGSPDDADWMVLLEPGGRRVLAVQLVERLERTTWPEHD